MFPVANKSQDKPTSPGTSKMSNDSAVLKMLASVVLIPSDSKNWFGLAEQAVGAIYVLSQHPDALCSEILRQKTKAVFQRTNSVTSLSREVSPDDMDIDEPAEELPLPPPERVSEHQKPSIALSQLLFAVGHIAI